MEALSWQRRAELWEPTDVLATDIVEAAVACGACVNLHCPALSSHRPTVPREPLPPYDDSTAYKGEEGG